MALGLLRMLALPLIALGTAGLFGLAGLERGAAVTLNLWLAFLR